MHLVTVKLSSRDDAVILLLYFLPWKIILFSLDISHVHLPSNFAHGMLERSLNNSRLSTYSKNLIADRFKNYVTKTLIKQN
ncbi:hypothetical protein ACJMK2_037609 [Sinanodonta woodiana]|uniref:Uncharacterized protein n=1 Tax=Sinanodonta woodiana TaxID=1069815 RepID=A0ABD3WN27_SINWO